jgi:hypothetical protein
MARVASPRRRSHFGNDCEKARALVRELQSFGEFCLDGISRR